jgi:hypothetical protein
MNTFDHACNHTLCYKHFFKNKNIPKTLKLILKNTITDKLILKNTITDETLKHASGTSILTKRDRKQLNIFERKVYRRILGPVYEIKKKIEGY